VLAQVKELWTGYGPLFEIWFDGGYHHEIKEKLSELLEHTQPHALVFGGYGVAKNPVRWIGTEAGKAPYPNWSTSSHGKSGGGDADGLYWVPGESDTTLQENDVWFYVKGHPIRSLRELQNVYHGTVGRNSNLLLDMAPTPEGVLDDAAVARYREFGDWVRGCYGPGKEANATGPVKGSTVEMSLNGATIDRVVLREDQSAGELVRNYTLQLLSSGGWQHVSSGTSVGNKRIDLFPGGAVAGVKAIRLTMVVDEGEPEPSLKSFAAYGPENCADKVVVV